MSPVGGRRGGPYPWEWFERRTPVACPVCRWPSGEVRPSRRVDLTCVRCGSIFDSFTVRLVVRGMGPHPTAEELAAVYGEDLPPAAHPS